MKKYLLLALLACVLAVPAQAGLFPPATPNALRVTDPSDIEGYSQVAFVTSVTGAEAAIPEGVYAVWAGTTDAFIKIAPTTGTASDVTTATGFVIRAAANPVRVVIRSGRKIGYISTGAGTLSLEKIN